MKKFISFIFCILLVAGCGTPRAGAGLSRWALFRTVDPPAFATDGQKESLELAEQMKEFVRKMDGLYDVAVVKGKGQTLVAFKVEHWKRYRMKKIEKQVEKALKKQFPGEDFTVSGDFKIFLEAVRLQDKAEEEGKDTDRELKRIIRLSREKT